jgi:hypothetical protein
VRQLCWEAKPPGKQKPPGTPVSLLDLGTQKPQSEDERRVHLQCVHEAPTALTLRHRATASALILVGLMWVIEADD